MRESNRQAILTYMQHYEPPTVPKVEAVPEVRNIDSEEAPNLISHDMTDVKIEVLGIAALLDMTTFARPWIVVFHLHWGRRRLGDFQDQGAHGSKSIPNPCNLHK